MTRDSYFIIKIQSSKYKMSLVSQVKGSLTKRYHIVVECTRNSVKKSSNLSIKRLINEFKSIMVNKGQIHEELGKFKIYI